MDLWLNRVAGRIELAARIPPRACGSAPGGSGQIRTDRINPDGGGDGSPSRLVLLT